MSWGETDPTSGLDYRIENGGVTITGETGAPSEIVIPEEINGLPVKSIDMYAFATFDELKSIKLPSSLNEIQEGAFMGTAISEITIPASVTKIGNMAFGNCLSLTSITFESSNDIQNYSRTMLESYTTPTTPKVIYVPKGMKEAYSQLFPDYTDIIQEKEMTPAQTYVTYANATASTVDGYSTITYDDGAKLALTGNSSKAYGGGNNITIDGKSIKGTKVSNGAQNTFYAPEGKKIYSVTLYSCINSTADPTTLRTSYWSEVNGVTYTEDNAKVMTSFRDGANPDVNTYTFNGVSSFTFTNKGEQNYFVIQVSYDAPTGITNVTKAEKNTQPTIKKVKNGKVVIVKGDKEYTIGGARIK